MTRHFLYRFCRPCILARAREAFAAAVAEIEAARRVTHASLSKAD